MAAMSDHMRKARRFTDDEREEAAQLLADGNSQAEVANLLDCSRGTISKWWRADEAFKARVEQIQAAANDAPTAKEIHEMTDAELGDGALHALAELAFSAKTRDVVRIAAANAVLDRVERNPGGARTPGTARDLLGDDVYNEIRDKIRASRDQ